MKKRRRGCTDFVCVSGDRVIYGAGDSEMEHTMYDWTKITAIAPFEALGFAPTDPSFNSTRNKQAQSLYCDAHRHRVKVLQWDDRSYNGVRCNASEFFLWAWASDKRTLNSTEVAAWASRTATCVAAQGFDGILLDAEGPCLEFWGAGCKLPIAPVKQAVTSAVCELKKALVAAIPGAEVHWAAGGPRQYTLIGALY